MKLLLTSNGLCNKSITNALFELTGKPAENTYLAFIPTSMNIEVPDKSWFINDLWNIKKAGFKPIDIVDISALPKEQWQPRLEAAEVLVFGGGNSSHLMRWIKESGLIGLLPNLLSTRVYVGISAGSIITGPSLATSTDEKKVQYEKMFGYGSDDALCLVDFFTRPHYNRPTLRAASRSYLEEAAKKLGKTVYGIDDHSALKVADGKVEIISEGKWVKV